MRHSTLRAPRRRVALLAAGVLALAASSWAIAQTAPAPASIQTVPGMPPVVDPANLYSETTPGKMSPAVAGALSRVYVPNVKSHEVFVIDPATMQVVDRYRVGINPQQGAPNVGVVAAHEQADLCIVGVRIAEPGGEPGAGFVQG